jgi:hypothetical protein
MSTLRIRHLLAGVLLWAVAAGCGGSALMATRPDVQTPGAARVVLREQEDDLFRFVVYNQSPYPMIVNRDAVRMATTNGLRNRIPGGIQSSYEIPPGGSHDVNVKFPMDGLQRGEQVWVHFQDAVSIGGQVVPIEPIIFVVK